MSRTNVLCALNGYTVQRNSITQNYIVKGIKLNKKNSSLKTQYMAVKCKGETCRLVRGSMRWTTPVIDTGSEILLPWFGNNGDGTFSC